MSQQTFLRDIISTELVEACGDDLYNYDLYENMPIKAHYNNSNKDCIYVVLFENDDIYLIDERACPLIMLMYKQRYNIEIEDTKYTIYTDRSSNGYDEYIVIVIDGPQLVLSYLVNCNREVDRVIKNRARLNYKIQISEEFSEQKPILENILDRYMEDIGKL